MSSSHAPLLDRVPVANLLRLAFYAGEALDELEDAEASRDDGHSFHELLAALLANAVERLRRGGLERGYVCLEDCSARPRGRIVLGETIARTAMAQGRLVHEHDDLVEDTPDNRVLKAAARILVRSHFGDGLPDDVDVQAPAHRLATLVRELRGVSDVRLNARLLGALPRSEASRRYRIVRFVARLIAECSEPDEASGADWARQLAQDPVRMRRLFERFVLRYAQRHAKAQVLRARYVWPDHPRADASGILPGLHTDVVLRGNGWTRIVECKYVPKLLLEHPRGPAQLRSAHLGQLHAYLSREAATRACDHLPSGLLLYPAAGRQLNHETHLGRFPVRVATLDLTLPWMDLRHYLDGLLQGQISA